VKSAITKPTLTLIYFSFKDKPPKYKWMACNLVNSVWHNKVKPNSRKENANLPETFYGYVFEALIYYKGRTLSYQ